MRKLLLLLSVVFCSLGAVAQITTGGVQWEMTQPADNIVSIWWRYEVTESEYANVTYKLYRIEYTGQDYATRSEVLVREMSAIQTLNNETIVIKEFENRLVDLNLTGETKYQFKFVVENKTEKIEVPVYLAGDNADTKYQFTYGLKWGTPAKTNEKSSSVTLHWQSHPQAAVYMVFGVDHEKALATTDILQATITNLELGTHHFVVRALDAEGNYLATTSPVEYTAVQVDCVTFPTVSASGNTVTLTILGYDNDGPFKNDKTAYTLANGDEEQVCRNISDNGTFTFIFASVDLTKEFKLTTTKTNDVKAIGLFRLDNNGILYEQYCDIVFELNVTHITQQTATLQWVDPGFAATKAFLTVTKEDGSVVVKDKEINPKVYIYAMDGLESGVDYVFELKLTDGYNQSKATAEAKTKVASICEVYETQAGSTVAGCGGGTFLVDYDLEFYTEYENGKPYIMVRFKPLSSEQINSIDLFYTTDSNILSFLNSLKTVSMTLNHRTGWYECRLDKFDKLLGSDVALEDGASVYFTVRAKPNKSCYWLYNYYHTKAVSYKVGTGCQDDTAVKTLSFTKLYPEQTQFTLQSNGRLASVGVFPNENYEEKERIFYNNFDDAPSHFTLDITDYAPGTYYLHIHDVYGEANSDSFKCIWAIY